MSHSHRKGSTTRGRALRSHVLQRDGYRCQIGYEGCTQRAELGGQHAGHNDHIIPLEMGGAQYDPANCRASCASCNLRRRSVERTTRTYEPPTTRVSSWQLRG